jgi:hypothetical protein
MLTFAWQKEGSVYTVRRILFFVGFALVAMFCAGYAVKASNVEVRAICASFAILSAIGAVTVAIFQAIHTIIREIRDAETDPRICR